MDPIILDDRTWLLVLTGAGVSAESGIPTFRDANGLWENNPIEKVASPQGFADDPILVWTFYSQRRQAARACKPNAGHEAIAAVEKRLGDRFLLATQNVDGLHVQAGSSRVIEMHGNLHKTRCSVCDLPPFVDDDLYGKSNMPACGRCNARGKLSLLRPHIVWFGETLDPADLARIDDFIREGAKERLVFLAAGTSGVVYPAAGLVDVSRRRGAETWLVNAEPPDNRHSFKHFAQGKSGEILPRLFQTA